MKIITRLILALTTITDDEWVRIEQRDNQLQVFHTTKVKDGLASGVLNGALGLVPFPLPFIEANKYDWENHKITGVRDKKRVYGLTNFDNFRRRVLLNWHLC